MRVVNYSMMLLKVLKQPQEYCDYFLLIAVRRKALSTSSINPGASINPVKLEYLFNISASALPRG